MSDEKPPRIKPRVKAAPKPRQVYWCDLPEDAHLPEFWKQRPVIILSKTAKLHGIVTVIPMTSKSQPDNKAAYAFASPFEGNALSWAVCDHILTVAVSRLKPPPKIIPRISEDDFAEILRRVLSFIPTPEPPNS